MQLDSSQLRKENSYVNKEFYNTSVLKLNSLTELCHDITNTEVIDVTVEKVKLNW